MPRARMGPRPPLGPGAFRPFAGGRAGRRGRPDLLGPDEELIAGRRPVEEAFVARRPALRLLVVPQRRQALERIVLHATSLRIPIVEVEGGTLTSVAGFDGHQGIALVGRPRAWATVDDVLARASERGEPPFVLVLDSLEDPQNVGTLLRSAEAVGVTRGPLPDAPPGTAVAGRDQGLGRRDGAPPACAGRRPGRRSCRPARARRQDRRGRRGRAADRPSGRPARARRAGRRQRGSGDRAGRPTPRRPHGPDPDARLDRLAERRRRGFGAAVRDARAARRGAGRARDIAARGVAAPDHDRGCRSGADAATEQPAAAPPAELEASSGVPAGEADATADETEQPKRRRSRTAARLRARSADEAATPVTDAAKPRRSRTPAAPAEPASADEPAARARESADEPSRASPRRPTSRAAEPGRPTRPPHLPSPRRPTRPHTRDRRGEAAPLRTRKPVTAEGTAPGTAADAEPGEPAAPTPLRPANSPRHAGGEDRQRPNSAAPPPDPGDLLPGGPAPIDAPRPCSGVPSPRLTDLTRRPYHLPAPTAFLRYGAARRRSSIGRAAVL